MENQEGVEVGTCDNCGIEHPIDDGSNFVQNPKKEDEWLCEKCFRETQLDKVKDLMSKLLDQLKTEYKLTDEEEQEICESVFQIG